jgi:hypothetical protein
MGRCPEVDSFIVLSRECLTGVSPVGGLDSASLSLGDERVAYADRRKDELRVRSSVPAMAG